MEQYIEVIEQTQSPLIFEVAASPIIEEKATVWTERGWATVDRIDWCPYGGNYMAAYCFGNDPKRRWGDWIALTDLQVL